MQQKLTKPILIDALHINTGGALMILNHLVNKLIEREIDFTLLKDARCPLLKSESLLRRVYTLKPNTRIRNKFYKEHNEEYSSFICLGNIPPCYKLSIPVYTYIHNVSLLKIPSNYPIKWKIKNCIKRLFIQFYAKNTDCWIVQTSHTASLVNKILPTRNKATRIFPFYYIPKNINKEPITNNRHDYVFIGEHTNAKGHDDLVKAWINLSNQGFDKTLHLTVASPDFKTQIEKAVQHGAKIINHGRISFDKVIDLYNKSKAIVYPSLNESLGLGIIEAIEAGCDVIGCDLPYMHSVCVPSEVFQPNNPESITSAVIRYENESSSKTKLAIRDMADDLITFIVKNIPQI